MANELPALLYGANGAVLLPSAAARADGETNPTTSIIAALLEAVNDLGTVDRLRVESSTVPNLRVALFNTSTRVSIPNYSNADAEGGNTQLGMFAQLMALNGANWDRWRNNLDNTALALLAATNATRTSADQTNYNARGLILRVNIANLANVPTFTPRIERKAPNGAYITIWQAAAALNANGDAQYVVYPGASGGNVTEVDGIPVPRLWRVVLAYTGNGTTDAADTLVDVSYIL